MSPEAASQDLGALPAALAGPRPGHDAHIAPAPMLVPRIARIVPHALCQPEVVADAWALVQRQLADISPMCTLVPCNNRGNLRQYLDFCVKKQHNLLRLCRQRRPAAPQGPRHTGAGDGASPRTLVRPSVLAIHVVTDADVTQVIEAAPELRALCLFGASIGLGVALVLSAAYTVDVLPFCQLDIVHM